MFLLNPNGKVFWCFLLIYFEPAPILHPIFFHLELWRHRQRSSAKALKNRLTKKSSWSLAYPAMTPCFSCAWSNHPLISLATNRISMDFRAWILGGFGSRAQPRTHSCRVKTLNFLEILAPFWFLFTFLEGWQRISLTDSPSVLWCHVTILESSDTLWIRRTRVDKGNYIWQFHTTYIISSNKCLLSNSLVVLWICSLRWFDRNIAQQQNVDSPR